MKQVANFISAGVLRKLDLFGGGLSKETNPSHKPDPLFLGNLVFERGCSGPICLLSEASFKRQSRQLCTEDGLAARPMK